MTTTNATKYPRPTNKCPCCGDDWWDVRPQLGVAPHLSGMCIECAHFCDLVCVKHEGEKP